MASIDHRVSCYLFEDPVIARPMWRLVFDDDSVRFRLYGSPRFERRLHINVLLKAGTFPLTLAFFHDGLASLFGNEQRAIGLSIGATPKSTLSAATRRADRLLV